MKALLASSALIVLAWSIPTTSLAAAQPASASWGVDPRNFSATVRPGDDFYRYVNEGWLKTAKAPDGLPFINAFVEVFLRTEGRTGEIINATRTATNILGSPGQLIGDYHRSHADMTRRNALGIKPIRGTLSKIAATNDRAGLARIMAYPWMSGIIDGGVLVDVDDPGRYIAAIGAGGLTMPSREYYLTDAEPYISQRKAFEDYVAATFRRAGIADPIRRAKVVSSLETEIAKRQWTTVQQRDVVAMNKVMTPAQLKAFAPGFPWDAYLSDMKFEGQPRIKVTSDTAIRDLASLFAQTSVQDLKSYLMFKTLDAWSESLSEPWVQAHFDFHGKQIQGTPQRRPAALESISATSAAFGEEIGRLYVEKYFSAADRATVDEMVGYLRDTYRERIEKLEWMDEATRKEALGKLAKVTRYIGFPQKWHDRSGIRIAPDDLVGNKNRISAWNRADSIKKLSGPKRLWEWPYPATEVNAGYSQSNNSITFPAGILQPPFFDPKADPAVNFGTIAAVIGHEFGHGFDDQGSRSDGDGRLRNWWSDFSRAAFEKRTAGLVDQFNGYEALPGLKINGRQNLGENIGDLGGLSVAYVAYRKYVAQKQGGTAPVIGGFTGDQRFFLAWAQLWRNVTSDAEVRRTTLSDPHSPGEFRVNGIVRNVDAWYDAFGVKPGDMLYLPAEHRVRIW